MLNISGIQEGFVLDHIQAGMSLQIYHDLKLDQLDCTVAIIKNAKSNKMGKSYDLGGGGQRRREGDERQQSFHGYRGLEVGF